MDKKILVVDDNHINRLFLEALLKKAGHQVVLAEDGYQAVELAQAKPFDLIFMDIRMQGMDGFETAKRIQAFSEAIMIGVSAEHIHDDEGVFAEALMKPLKVDAVLDSLKHHIIDKNMTFNEQHALAAANNNPAIMNQLRRMFQEQLPQQMNQANALISQNNAESLHDLLHQILGSAQMCAASPLIESIKQYKNHIKQNPVTDHESELLWKEVEERAAATVD